MLCIHAAATSPTCFLQGTHCHARHITLAALGLPHQIAQQQHTRLQLLRALLQQQAHNKHRLKSNTFSEEVSFIHLTTTRAELTYLNSADLLNSDGGPATFGPLLMQINKGPRCGLTMDAADHLYAELQHALSILQHAAVATSAHQLRGVERDVLCLLQEGAVEAVCLVDTV